MRQWRRRVVGARRPVHERHGAERRLADQRACHGHVRSGRRRDAPARRELHRQVVRMLMVGDLEPFVGFAALKDLRVASTRGRERLDAQHPDRAERSATQRPGGVGHHPVLRSELGLAASPALVVEGRKQGAVQVQRPVGRVGRRCLLVGVVGRPRLLRAGQIAGRQHQHQRRGASAAHPSAR